LAKNEYILRHDKVSTHLHYSVCKKLLIGRRSNIIEYECNAKGGRKEIKIQNVSIETERMWNIKCFVIPVITRPRELQQRG